MTSHVKTRREIPPIWLLIVNIGVAIVGAIVSAQFDPKKDITVFCAVAFALLSFNILGISIALFQNSHHSGQLTEIQERLLQMVEHTAFFTEKNELQSHVDLLHRTTGRVTWIVAKFISKKLANSFASLKINISGPEYSKFANDLYRECETSIYLTSPFTLREWFLRSLGEDATVLVETGHGAKVGPPIHMLALKAASAETKRRFVILSDEEWKKVNCEHEKHSPACAARRRLVEKFNEFSDDAKVSTRFVSASELASHLVGAQSGSRTEIAERLLHFDYAEFDHQLILRWEMPAPGQERTDLVLNPSDEKIQLENIFDAEFDRLGRLGEKILEKCAIKDSGNSEAVARISEGGK